MEDDPARRRGFEHAVDDHAVEVQVGIERRTEAVDERDRTEPARLARTLAVCAQPGLHRRQLTRTYVGVKRALSNGPRGERPLRVAAVRREEWVRAEGGA